MSSVLAELAHYDKDYRKEAQEALCRGLRDTGNGGTAAYSASEIKNFLAAVVKQVRARSVRPIRSCFVPLSLSSLFIFPSARHS